MLNSVHYLKENNNRINIKTLFVRRTRLTPKMTTTNCHVICKRDFPLCEDTPISFIIIHDGIKNVVVNIKSKLLGLRIDRFFVIAHNIKRL